LIVTQPRGHFLTQTQQAWKRVYGSYVLARC